MRVSSRGTYLLERGGEGTARGRLDKVEVVHVGDAEHLEREHDPR